MKIEYDPEADALYIRLRPGSEGKVESKPISEDVVADYGPDGKVVGIEILFASTVLDDDRDHVVLEIARPAGVR